MPLDAALDLLREALLTALIVVAPLLAGVFLVSFIVSLLQSATGIQDPTVALVPKLGFGGLMLVWLLPWMVERLSEFSHETYRIGW